jgi:pheromone shutdown protein TraB
MVTENKVYLITTQKGTWDDFGYNVIVCCKDIETAEKEKAKIEEKIQNLKTLYLLEFERDYDQDCEQQADLEEKNWKRFSTFQKNYPEVKIDTVLIEERDLI